MRKIAKIQEEYAQAKEYRSPLDRKWVKFYKYYRAYRKNKAGESNIFVPYPFSTIESELPILVANRPRWEVKPNHPDDVQSAEIMDKLVNYQYDRMRMFPHLYDVVKTSLIYGTGVAKVYWRFDAEAGYDDPVFEDVDIFDFFIDPNATSIENARYVFHRKWVSEEYIKANYKKSFSISKGDNEGRRNRSSVAGMNDPAEKEIELVERWDDKTKVVFADGVILKDEENPYPRKPFFDFTPIPLPHEFYGVSELDECESLYWELNDMRNDRATYNTMSLNPMLQIDRTANIDPEAAVFSAGGILYHDNTGSNPVNLLTVGNVPQTSYQEEIAIKNDIQEATAVNAYTRGSTARTEQTATGVARQTEGSFARFDAKLGILEQFLVDVGGFIKDLNLLNIDVERVIRIVGPMGQDFALIDPEEIKGDYDLSVIKGATLPQSKAVQQQQAMNALNLFGQDPFITEAGAIGIRKKVVEAFGWVGTDDWFAPPPPMGLPEEGGLLPHENQPSPTSDAEIQRMMANMTGMEGGV